MKIQEVPIDKIMPYWHNPRINDRTVEKLVTSISEFGFNSPIVVNKDYVIITGHARLKAAKRLGMTTVPVNVVNLTDEQAKRYRIADNKIAELSKWEQESLMKELQEIGDRMELMDMGFDMDEIDSAIGSQEEFMDAMDEQAEDYQDVVVGKPAFEPQTFYSGDEPTEEELQAQIQKRSQELETRFPRETQEPSRDDLSVCCPFCERTFTIRGLGRM